MLRPTDRIAVADAARRAEDLGFDTITVADHLVDGLLPPIATLTTMAEATSRIRVGTLVLNNDFRHPALLAREAAAIDLFSEGRLELGLGAGHAAPEYAEIGLAFDPAAKRVERLGEAIGILRRLFDGEAVTCNGRHYQLRDHRLFPQRRPTLLVGGNGNHVLEMAARQADIVGFTGLGRTLSDGQRHEAQWSWDQIDTKVAHVRRSAGERLPALEFNALVQHIAITDDPASIIAQASSFTGAAPEIIGKAPYLLVGSLERIVEQLEHARKRWDFTYFVTRDAEATGRVIDALRR